MSKILWRAEWEFQTLAARFLSCQSILVLAFEGQLPGGAARYLH